MKILVAVPIFNEEKYVAPVLREIRKYARAAALSNSPAVETRILVVDDGSTDGTPAVLRDLAARGHIDLLTHPENRGYGQSLIDAFAFAARSDHGGPFDWVITMDCDEQHEPCRIPLFVEQCLHDDADIISGSRYLRTDWNGEGGPPPDRRNINRIITELLNASLHLTVLPPALLTNAHANGHSNGNGNGTAHGDDAPRLTDSFCGFKAHRVSALQQMNLTIPGYAFPMQFWAQAAALDHRIREIPVKLIYKDATRHFGGVLDDPTARLQHYLAVLTHEIEALRDAEPAPAKRAGWFPCACSCG